MKKAFTLAEGAAHVAIPNKKRSFGFTLAEVLITLGIIGVVAAITMPTLIQNHQKQVYVNQLKKSYSMLEQGFQKMLADEGVEKLTDLPYWNNYDICNVSEGKSAAQSLVNDILSKGFIVTYNEQPDYILSGCDYIEDGYTDHIQFADNTKLIQFHSYNNTYSQDTCEKIKSLGGTFCRRIADISIDVNGTKGPNKMGRDVFSFVISDEGKLYPMYGKDFALANSQVELASNHLYWKNSSYYSCTNENGIGCAARIIENGWKMDY